MQRVVLLGGGALLAIGVVLVALMLAGSRDVDTLLRGASLIALGALVLVGGWGRGGSG